MINWYEETMANFWMNVLGQCRLAVYAEIIWSVAKSRVNTLSFSLSVGHLWRKTLGSFNFFGEVRPSAILTRAWSALCGLLSPTIVENARFVHAELCGGDLGVIGGNVLHDVCFRLVLVGWRVRLVDSRCHETVLGFRDWRLMRILESRRHHICTNRLWMDVWAWPRQLLFLVEIVVVEFVDAATVSIHPFPHAVVGTLLAESGVLFVLAGRRRADLLFGLVVQSVDVQFKHVVTTCTHWPTFSGSHIWAKSARWSQIATRRRQGGIFDASIVLLETPLMRSECVSLLASEFLESVELTSLVEDIFGYVPCVLLELWEPARLAEAKLCFWNWIVTGHLSFVLSPNLSNFISNKYPF